MFEYACVCIAATRSMVIDGAATEIREYQRIFAEGGHLEGLDRDEAFVATNAAALQAWVNS